MTVKHFSRSFFIATLVFIGNFAIAQDTPVNQKDTTALKGKIEEVTVTAFRSPYNIFNTPAPVNLISPMQLDLGNSFTPIEALNQVPGILIHHGTTNTNRLTIRGIGSRTPYSTNKIKAYLGEIPLTSGDGETTLEDLENSAIQRIEIIKGPSSSLYGAGLAGVILFHPKNVLKNFAQNKTTVASFGTFKNTLSAGITCKKLNIFTLGSVFQSDGFRENNNTDRFNFLINSIYSFSERSKLQLLFKATKMKAFIPSSLALPTYLESPEKAASNWKEIEGFEDYSSARFGISYNHFTQNDEKISVGTFGNLKKLDELRPFNTLKESSDYIGWRAYIQKLVAGPKTSLVFTSGLEFFRENFDWNTYSNDKKQMLSDNNEKRQYENLFFQIESNISDILFLSVGVNGNLTRFTYTDNYLENGDQSGKHLYKPILSPRFGLNILANKNLSIFGNVSHGFSTPTFEETLLPEGELNTAIKPESGWSTEIGFRSQITDRFQISASYYKIYVRNLLVARRTGQDAYIGINAGKSAHPGVETEIKWNVINPGSYPSFSFSGNATFSNAHFQEFVDNGINYTNNLLPGTAKSTWLALGNINTTKNFSINAWYRFTDEMAVNDANSDFSTPFGIANAELKYRGNINNFKIEIKAGILNLFNEKYAAMLAVNAPSLGANLPRYYYPGNPRNYFVSVLIGLE